MTGLQVWVGIVLKRGGNRVPQNGLLDHFPLWTVLVGTVVVLLLCVEIGYRLARYRREHAEGENEASVGAMVGSTLGLLAFMLAFTFSLAASRFEGRRQVLLDEANAIGTTYLRATMLAEPARSNCRNLLREYVDVRIEGAQPGKVEQAIAMSVDLQNRLWSEAVAATEKDRSAVTGLFVQSLNEVIDLHAKRVMLGLRSRVPAVIWMVLYLLAVLAMTAIGYHQGLSRAKRSLAAVALTLAFSAVLVLVVDLDRPGEGLLKVSHQSMIDLQKSMRP
ncbi:MAG TPA: hypothetical protein VFV34_27380 [Blastocatellia bacterium]|nr:hypothetical protein [Blastocatellia bacterium]